MNVRTLAFAVSRSLLLDWAWIRTIHIEKKWQFLISKYLFLCFPKNQFRMWDKTILLPSKRHIGFLQSVFTDHAFLPAYIPPHATIIDIGAHIGEFALMASVYLKAKHVISIEPTQRSFELLKHNTSGSAYHTAICPADFVTMHIPALSIMTSGYTVSETDEVERVPCTFLDALPEIQALQKIDLLKIDVEGMEYDVLATCANTLQKTTYLLIEVSLDRPAGATAITTIEKIHTLLPHARLVHIGHIHINEHTTKENAVDLLFRTTPL